mmetsp:Transcript_18769/g.42831  ORF Transcript_18769/g.42831 Transcript_18769/m.42831 type:complete len:108 (-) Transcript_18769:158-481(-)
MLNRRHNLLFLRVTFQKAVNTWSTNSTIRPSIGIRRSVWHAGYEDTAAAETIAEAIRSLSRSTERASASSETDDDGDHDSRAAVESLRKLKLEYGKVAGEPWVDDVK